MVRGTLLMRRETSSNIAIDTLRVFYPMIRKIEGVYVFGANSGRTSNDKIRMRLAETYLLRAEAYFHSGNNCLGSRRYQCCSYQGRMLLPLRP